MFESKEFLTTIFIEQGLAEELNNGNRLKRSLVPTVSRVTRRDFPSVEAIVSHVNRNLSINEFDLGH